MTAERLSALGGGLAIVGTAHHCMVDGAAVVELGNLLFDSDAEPLRDGADAGTLPDADADADALGRDLDAASDELLAAVPG